MSDFKDLKVWQKAHRMSLDTHQIAGRVRGSRNGSLRSQIVRAAQSVPTNIVESRGQESAREATRFLRIALNSTTELEYHLIAARDIRAIGERDFERLTNQVIEVRKMLYGLIRYLRTPSTAPPRT